MLLLKVKVQLSYCSEKIYNYCSTFQEEIKILYIILKKKREIYKPLKSQNSTFLLQCQNL